MSLVQRPISLLLFEKSGIVEVFKDLLKFYQTSDVPLRLDPNDANHLNLIAFLEGAIPFVYPRSDSAIGIDPEKRRWNMYFRLFYMIVDGKDDFPSAANRYEKFTESFERILQQILIGILQASQNIQYTGKADPAALADLLNEFRNNFTRYYYVNNTILTIQQSYDRFQILMSLLQSPPPPGGIDYAGILMAALNIQSNQIEERLTQLGNIVNNERQRLGLKALNVSTVLQFHLTLGQDIAGFIDTVLANPNWDAAAASQLYAAAAQRDFFRRIINNWKKIVNPAFEFEGSTVSTVTSPSIP